MPFNARVPTTEYIRAVNRAPVCKRRADVTVSDRRHTLPYFVSHPTPPCLTGRQMHHETSVFNEGDGAALTYERHRADDFDPFVLGETPAADVAAAKIAVLAGCAQDNRWAGGGALSVDLSVLDENMPPVGQVLRASDHHRSRTACARAQPVTDRGSLLAVPVLVRLSLAIQKKKERSV